MTSAVMGMIQEKSGLRVSPKLQGEGEWVNVGGASRVGTLAPPQDHQKHRLGCGGVPGQRTIL